MAPNQDLLETFVFALPQHAFDVAKLNYLICSQRSGDQKWHVSVDHRPDGSIWIDNAIGDDNFSAGLKCRYQIRGEYYPI